MPESPAHRAAAVLVRTPRLARVVARLLVAGTAGLVLLMLAPWQQSASGEGRVVAFTPVERRQTIEAPIEGRIVRWLVREGSRVEEGDVICEISDNDPDILQRLRDERAGITARLAAVRARADSLEDRIAFLIASRDSAVDAAASRVRMAQDRVRAAMRVVEVSLAALRTAELQLERQRALESEGLASRRTLELAELDLARTRTDLDRAEAALSAARAEELALRAEQQRIMNDASAAIDDARAARAAALAEIGSADAEIARIDVRLARQSTMTVRAPARGTVLRLSGGLGGEMVKMGDPLVVFVPDTDARAVEMWVAGVDVPLLRENRRVRLQFEGWPAVQFTGWPSVAVGTFGGRVALIDAADDGNGRFRVLVTPDPDDEPWPSGRYLRQGVRANGWVLLGRVTVGYELWRRFNAFPPTVAMSEPMEGGDRSGKEKK
jgi:multidrug efflux pump subunit AcrA (membrane-fusion protein)